MMKATVSLGCWHSISSRVRGSSEFSKHLAMFISQADIGLHEALLIERRGSSERGVGLFTNHACDSGTAIAVVPNARAVTSTSLSSLGCHYAFNVPSIDANAHGSGITVGMPPNWMGVGLPATTDSSRLLSHEWLSSTSGVLESLLGCTRGQWVELAWRLALERCCAHTYWWGWCDSLPSRAEIQEDRDRVERHVRLQAPHLVSTYTRLRTELDREVSDAFSRLSATCAVPSSVAFQWAVDVLLSRSISLVSGPSLLSSGASPVSLGICPVMDIANGASSSFSVLHNTRMAMGDNQGEGDGDVVAQREMLLEARRSVHLSPPSSSRGGGSSSHHTIPNCEVEVATSPCELPIWYRREYLQLPSSLCKADNTEEDFEEATDMGTLTSRKVDTMFPAFVLTTTKPVAAGGELLRHYDAGSRTWWKGEDDASSPETDLRERLTNQVDSDLLLPREFGVTDRGDALALGMMLRYNFSNY